jgi:uncharacterized protein YukE
MRTDEQCYPIEKSTTTEQIWQFSAFQITYLLRATDHEAMFEAAKDYRDTADNLDRTAEQLRRGARDLANAWRGEAAGDSLTQLRQYYASARSLAADCRASSVAVAHAARALGMAQARAALLYTNPIPSTNPTSLESIKYQQIFADLNVAYTEAIALAPNQLAITLPHGHRADEQGGDDWAARASGVPPDDGDGRNAYGSRSGIPEGLARPAKLPSAAPPIKPRDERTAGTPIVDIPKAPRMEGGSGRQRLDDGSVREARREGRFFEPQTTLAGLTTGPAPFTPLLNDSTSAGPSTQDTASNASRSSYPASQSGAERSRAGGGQGGFIPAGTGRQDDSDRERRYYLPEEPDIWGIPDAMPSVLYGEATPPVCRFDDDDDDDDF